MGRRELIQFRDMTIDIRDRVRALIADGKTLDEVAKELSITLSAVSQPPFKNNTRR